MVNPLPLDVWYRILSSFSPAEICRLRQVNRAFYDLTRERQVWVDAYLNTRLPTSDGPISSKSAKELEMELRRTAMLDACYGGSMSPVLRHQINGLPGFDPTRHLFDPPGFHRERYGWMNLVRGRWLVACHARANRITCYDLEASDPSEAPISWGAITGDRIYAATCYACAEEDALLYAYVDGEDAITVLKLQLSPYPITFQRIHRLEWNFHELPDVRQDAFKLFQLVLNESWLFACCLGRNNYIGTLFHLHSQGIYSVPYPEISSAGDVHDLQWYMPFLTSTHLWLFTGSASSRALFPLSTPGRFELFTLPKAESVVDPASPLTLSHSRRFDNWYMIFGAYALSTHSQLSTLSVGLHTLRLLMWSLNRYNAEEIVAEIVELTAEDAGTGNTPGTIAIHKLRTPPITDYLWGKLCICSGRSTWLAIPATVPRPSPEDDPDNLTLYRFSALESDGKLILGRVNIPIPMDPASRMVGPGAVAFDAAAGRLCVFVTQPTPDPSTAIRVYDLVPSLGKR